MPLAPLPLHLDLAHPVRLARAVRRPSRWTPLVLAGLIVAGGCHTPKRPAPGTSEYAGISAEDWKELDAKSAFSVGVGELERRLEATLRPGQPLKIDVLMMSGGGQNGAFGAAILTAWPRESEAESHPADTVLRPVFDMVTGVSTGAILATGAFLDDPKLQARVADFYATATDKDVYTVRSFLTALFSSGAAKQDGLRKMLEEVFEDSVIDRVAAEHEKGRSLWIGTSNMDTGRFQTWNLTHVALRARAGSKDFYDLYRDLILASASIPLFFEPQYINGYMHCDGGVHANLFAPGIGTRPAKLAATGPFRVRHYMIRNGKLDIPAEITTPSLMGIGKRALASLMLLNDAFSMVRIRDYSRRLEDLDAGLEIHSYFAYIQDDFTAVPDPGKRADPSYTSKLEAYGRDFVRKNRWLDHEELADLVEGLEQ